MGSRQPRMQAAKQALAGLLKGLSADTQVGILTLNSQVDGSHWIVPVGPPSVERWEQPLMRIRAKGGTPLGQFVRQGADELLQLRAGRPFSTYRLLVVTDGEATDAKLLGELLPDLLSRGIRLDVIGVDMAAEHSLARSAHSYRSAADQTTLAQALSEVFAETGADAQATQDDFDMLAAVPDDVAAAIVHDLAVVRNEPLQNLPNHVEDRASTPAGVQSLNSNASSNRSSLGSAVLGSFCCLGVFGGILLLIVSIVLFAFKKKSPR